METIIYLIILSNIGLALMMIIVYARYSKFRISSSREISELRKRVDHEIEDKKSLQERLLLETKADGDKIQDLLREVDELRKSKEGEMRLRLEAEKQIELALQKTDEMQKRMHDWSLIQEAVMKDSKDAIVKIGNELFRKLNESYKNEIETNKNMLGKFSKNIADFVEKSVSSIAVKTTVATSEKSVFESTKSEAPKNSAAQATSPQLVADLVKTMNANGWVANREYFLPTNFDEQKSKLFLCDTAFISLDKLYIIDFKASHYLEEYLHSKDEKVLQQKLDRYLEYLANPKYLESILKIMATTKVKFDKSGIVIAVASKEEIAVLKDLKYYDKARNIASEILDINGVNNLVL